MSKYAILILVIVSVAAVMLILYRRSRKKEGKKMAVTLEPIVKIAESDLEILPISREFIVYKEDSKRFWRAVQMSKIKQERATKIDFSHTKRLLRKNDDK